jgi:hypothetical protein
MNIDQALAVLEHDHVSHLTQLCSEKDLDQLEASLGRRLPTSYRALLARVGCGILYDRHEIFGGRRLMLHDIEMVPDLLSLRARLEADGSRRWPETLVPFHRTCGVFHLLDLSGGEGPVPVTAAETGRTYPDLPDFLEAVILLRKGSETLAAR